MSSDEEALSNMVRRYSNLFIFSLLKWVENLIELLCPQFLTKC